jgi:hypothetical protein
MVLNFKFCVTCIDEKSIQNSGQKTQREEITCKTTCRWEDIRMELREIGWEGEDNN